ncbi:MAG TPA: LysR family transcriptional regulator [Gammaproteobacteria bacterium]|nr:LysR family transcriptional regulator [Gammaproteobacteria bacterium]
MPALNWNNLRYVLAAARSKTLAGAARSLDVNERTVARRIAQIETSLKARLFDRNAGKLVPTEMGELAIASAERVEIESQQLEHRVAGADLRAAGVVRMTAVPVLINRLLIPSIGSLIDRHPDLELELIAEPRNLSLSKREADIALRMARPTDETRVVARRLGRIDYVVFAAARRRPGNLPWINYDDGLRDLPQARWMAEQSSAEPASQATLAVNDTEAILAAVRAGLGKSLLPVFLGDSDPELVRLQESVCLSREVWLMIHPDLRHLARIRAVIDWLDVLFKR